MFINIYYRKIQKMLVAVNCAKLIITSIDMIFKNNKRCLHFFLDFGRLDLFIVDGFNWNWLISLTDVVVDNNDESFYGDLNLFHLPILSLLMLMMINHVIEIWIIEMINALTNHGFELKLLIDMRVGSGKRQTAHSELQV